MRRIRSKLFIGFLCMAVLTVSLLWLIYSVFMKDNYLNERVRSINAALLNAKQNSNIEYQDLETGFNISLFSVDSGGNILYMSQGLPMRGMILHQIQSIMQQDTEGKPQYIQTTSNEIRYAVLGQALNNGGKIYAVFSLVDVEEASRILLQQLWVITAVLLVFSIILAIILSRMFALPIGNVTQAAREMAAGKYDISLPVRTHDEIGQLTIALNELGIQLQKTEALRRELIANVSHELRSPLSIIKGFAETVRDVTWPNEEKRSEQLTMISEEASRLSRIVNDILDYSRLQSGVEQISITDFQVYPVLKDIADRYELEAAKKGLSLQLDCPYLTVRFDPARFTQVLNNLLSNALNYSYTGSKIHIFIKDCGNKARISVKNTGNTIPPEEFNNIWDRYYRVEQIGNSKLGGTGLGLSIVKSILDKHGISYGVNSKNGETVFWFETLPLK